MMLEPVAADDPSSNYRLLCQMLPLELAARPMPQLCSGALECYSWARAQIILGQNEYASAALNAWGGPPPNDPHPAKTQHHPPSWLQICQAQIDGVRLKDLAWHMGHLGGPKEHLLDDPFLDAERVFTAGFLLLQSSRFREALQVFRSARDRYRELGLWHHVGITVFNLCICANHLNLAEPLNRYMGELQEAAARASSLTLRAFLSRFSAYRAVDREDYRQASSLLAQAAADFHALGRVRDYQGLLSIQAFVALKSEDLEAFSDLMTRFEASPDPLDSFVLRMRCFAKIHEAGLMDERHARRILRECKDCGLDGVSLLFVVDLLLSSLIRAKDYLAVVRLFKSVLKLSLKHEQSSDLVDYRFHAILAHHSLGHRLEAGLLLSQYEADARRQGSEAKLRKVETLREFTGLVIAPRARASSEASPAIIDLDQEILLAGGHEEDLSGQRMLLRIFAVLREFPHGIGYEELFERCYKAKFNPVLHGSRFHSLISRARKRLGRADALMWADGRLRLNSSHVQCWASRSSRGRAGSRRRKIKTLIGSFSSSATVSQLERACALPRRTLQLDLNELVKSGAIEKIGGGRGTRYLVRRPSA